MVKGITKRVVVIKSPDPKIFDEAIFLVREDALHKAITQEEVMREAQETANQYIEKHVQKKVTARIPAPAFAAIGAVCTGAVWALTQIL